MADSKKDTVHATEAQRQFVRITLPATAMLEGKTYSVKDLSSGGLALEDIKTPYERDEHIDLTLSLPFTEFYLTIDLEASVKNYSKSKKTLGVSFVSLTPTRLSLLKHIIKAYISGDVITSGDLLNVVGRENFINAKKTEDLKEEPLSPDLKIKKKPWGLYALLTIVLLSIIGYFVYKNVLTLSYSNGILASEMVIVRSPIDGYYDSLIDKNKTYFTEIDKIAKVKGTSGNKQLDIKSPCNCTLIEELQKEGEYIERGTALFQLAPHGARPYISVVVPSKDAEKLRVGQEATINIYAHGIEQMGKIVDMKQKTETSIEDPEPKTELIIMINEKLPIEMVGSPVSIFFLLL